MIKKNLFILFNFYFFVVQLVLVGFLWDSYRFFYLALINFVFILIISLLSKRSKTEEVESNIVENKTESKEKSNPDIVHKIHYAQKPKDKKKIHHFWFFLISILFGFSVWFWLPEFEIHSKLFISIFASFLLYIIFSGLFKIKPFKTREIILFIITLFGLIVGFLFNYLNLKDIIADNIGGQTVDTGDLQTQNNFVSVDMDIITGTSISDTDTKVDKKDEIESNIENLSNPISDQNANFRDVIKFLIDKNNIKLQTNKNISFSLIATSDTDYLYFRTAYSLGMVGKNLNPEKFPLCETYVVMMGLVKNWPVNKGLDIKKDYWNYAKTNNLLPSCHYGEVVKFKDME